MLMTPMTPNVIASPMAARRSTEPSDSPYQTFCAMVQSASRPSRAALAQSASERRDGAPLLNSQGQGELSRYEPHLLVFTLKLPHFLPTQSASRSFDPAR